MLIMVHSITNKDVKRALVLAFGDQCDRCGQHYEQDVVYDFHHLDRETKEYNISQAYNLAYNDIKLEAEKCVMLCSNCHRIVEHTFDNNTMYSNFDEDIFDEYLRNIDNDKYEKRLYRLSHKNSIPTRNTLLDVLYMNDNNIYALQMVFDERAEKIMSWCDSYDINYNSKGRVTSW